MSHEEADILITNMQFRYHS